VLPRAEVHTPRVVGTSLVATMLWGSMIVDGTTACPTPPMAQALIPRESADRLRGDALRAELVDAGARLRVRLLDGEGKVLAERLLETGPSCAGLAHAAAAVISTLELEVSAAPAVELVAVPRPEGTAAPSPTASLARTNRSRGERAGVAFDVGAAFLGSATGDGLAPAGAVMLRLRSRTSAFRLDAGFFAEGRRDLVFTDGKVSYQRFWVSLGPGYELTRGRLSVELQLGLLGAFSALAGDGVTSVSKENVLDGGGALGLTAQWTLGQFAPWVGLFGLWWPGGTKVEIGALTQSRSLPSSEALLGIGLRFGSS